MSRQDESGRLGRVIVKSVTAAYADDAQIDAQWRELNYPHRPDLATAIDEYRQFAGALRNAGAELHHLAADDDTGLDSIYPRDAAVMCDAGAILCSMGKPARRGEPAALRAAFDKLDVPVRGEISADGLLEGGDVVWLGPRTIAVGLGYRSNLAGITQLETLLDGMIDEFIVVPLPHWRGPGDVFHLMSIISPIDRDLAVVYSPLLPVPFRQRLLELGIELIEVPDREFPTQGCNILALAPRHALVLDGNPVTAERLRTAGVQVENYQGTEISLNGGGGPTCLTRPVERFA